ncbi:hypothetical protein BGW37DRAFT_39248 [Umbelopsis sp. PMI_123]|nr:hypothetical protein BGW37DRAFT_39248 [Umbelopsis sp. PMI_123]
MGIFSEEPQKTSVTHYVDRLSNYDEIEWYQFQQLSEVILIQENGPREAVEAVRKRLKHGTTQQKIRVLDVLKLLMENSNQRFHRQLTANDKMRERIEIIITSPSEDLELRKELVSLLGTWSAKYKDEPGMRTIADLYELGRSKLGLGSARRQKSRSVSRPPQSPSSPGPATSNIIDVSDDIPPQQPARPIQHPPPTKEQKRRSLPPSKPAAAKTKPRSNTVNSPQQSGSRFNFATAKPKIIEQIALANQNCNNLMNALKLINTEEERWEVELQHDARIQEYVEKCEESRKKIVRYTRLVEDEDWIGTLLATNEDLLKALQAYEMMSIGEAPPQLPSPTTATQSTPPPQPPRPGSRPKSSSSPPLNEEAVDISGMHISMPPPPSMPTRPDPADPFADPFADPDTPVEEYPRHND